MTKRNHFVKVQHIGNPAVAGDGYIKASLLSYDVETPPHEFYTETVGADSLDIVIFPGESIVAFVDKHGRHRPNNPIIETTYGMQNQKLAGTILFAKKEWVGDIFTTVGFTEEEARAFTHTANIRRYSVTSPDLPPLTPIEKKAAAKKAADDAAAKDNALYAARKEKIKTDLLNVLEELNDTNAVDSQTYLDITNAAVHALDNMSRISRDKGHKDGFNQGYDEGFEKGYDEGEQFM